jgi:hypothetical protein
VLARLQRRLILEQVLVVVQLHIRQLLQLAVDYHAVFVPDCALVLEELSSVCCGDLLISDVVVAFFVSVVLMPFFD